MTNAMMGKDAELDQLLAGLGTVQPAVPDALMARILADAATIRDDAEAARVQAGPAAGVARASFWVRIAVALGGGRVLAGLGTAAVAGVVLGFAQPAPIATLSSTVWGLDFDVSVDLLPTADDFLAEG
jgi:hypothetical protein